MCDGRLFADYDVSFAVALGPSYSIFVRGHFLPGLDAGSVNFTLRVDDGEPLKVQSLGAQWFAGLLTVSGRLGDPSYRDALERGTEVVADIDYGNSILITQSFSLRGSSDALAELSCP